jgi:3-hydroxymyristoyl/3-hydroxydecanoyl-(acyl carrier protein) dehydratase
MLPGSVDRREPAQSGILDAAALRKMLTKKMVSPKQQQEAEGTALHKRISGTKTFYKEHFVSGIMYRPLVTT